MNEVHDEDDAALARAEASIRAAATSAGFDRTEEFIAWQQLDCLRRATLLLREKNQRDPEVLDRVRDVSLKLCVGLAARLRRACASGVRVLLDLIPRHRRAPSSSPVRPESVGGARRSVASEIDGVPRFIADAEIDAAINALVRAVKARSSRIAVVDGVPTVVLFERQSSSGAA